MSFARQAFRVTGAVVSAAALLVAGAVVLSGRVPLPSVSVDTQRSAASTQEVAQLNSTVYCPARMQLADAENYGDADFQPTAGNLASSGRVSAMGALYQADTAAIDADAASSLIGDGALADSAVRSTSVDTSASSVLHARTLEAKAFTGVRGVSASWASQGDLRGISASSCVGFETSQSFLVPPTSTGWSQQLIVANASDKATSLTLHVHTTSSDTEVSLETHATATVAAHAETVVDLSAAFTSDDVSYVTVQSDAAPVAAVIRAVHMNGLTPQGSDYIEPLGLASTNQAIPALSGAASVQLALYAAQAGSVRLTFVGDSGKLGERSVRYTAHQVSSQALNSVPEGTRTILLESTTELSASALTTVSAGDGAQEQSDFSMNEASSAHSAYAVVAPDSVAARVEMTNVTDADTTAHVVAYDDSGAQVGQRDVALTAQSSDSFALTDIAAQATSVHISQTDTGKKTSGALVVGELLTQSSLSDASVAQRAVLTIPSMELSTAQYEVTHRKTLLN